MRGVPQRERFVGEGAALFLATFIKNCDRFRQGKWRACEIKQAPIAIFDVLVHVMSRKRCGQQITRSAIQDISQRRSNIGKGKMHQAIATKNEIRERKLIAR